MKKNPLFAPSAFSSHLPLVNTLITLFPNNVLRVHNYLFNFNIKNFYLYLMLAIDDGP